MPMTAEDIKTLIKSALPDAHIEIDDLRGDGDHYAARVASAEFAVYRASSSIKKFMKP